MSNLFRLNEAQMARLRPSLAPCRDGLLMSALV